MAAASSGVAPDAAAVREDLFGPLDRAFLIEVRRHQPLVQVERVAGGGEDGAAVDDAERAVHAQAKTFEHGGEVPGIDHLAVDRGLAAHGVEPGAVQEGRQQRMAGERLVEPGERRGGLRQGAGQRRIRFPGAGRSSVSSIFSIPGGPPRIGRRHEAPRRLAWPCATDPRRINDLRVRLRKPGDSVQQPCYRVPTPFPALRMPDKTPCRA